ncbi:nucleotide kinase [Holotrichia oblita]|uniref:Nucleotide kinase n=1 Tax=Holotrichia oblita TaxID=644536 RepID=A0ACB9TGZ4_HOLOL|nr:nucleotide kinase [Holotrichia oblita]
MENGKRKLCSKCNPHLVERKVQVPIVCIIGQSGSGKGIQCDKIVAKYGFEHILTEYLASAEYKCRKRSKLFVNIDDETPITDSNLAEELKTEMFKHLNTAKGFAIDTFPNNIDQAKLFEHDIAPIDLIFFLMHLRMYYHTDQ